MKNLFLEGPIQTGKSTLIREVLAPYMDCVDGFTCQRLLAPAASEHSSDEKPLQVLGYRIAPADSSIDLELDPDFVSKFLEANDTAALPDGIFKLFTPTGAKVYDKVFETMGVRLMKQSFDAAKSSSPTKADSPEAALGNRRSIKLMLLDEIGGHELLNNEFRETLYAILESDIPSIGVIKHRENTKHMVRRLPTEEAEQIINYNLELRKKITGLDNELGEICYYERGLKGVREKLEAFVHNAAEHPNCR